ncbi:Anion exchange protein 3, partial [Halocaridina rubra]
PSLEEDAKPKRRKSEQMNEDMERMFENQGDAEDFSLSKLSSVSGSTSSPWSPGYDEQQQSRSVDDARIRDLEIKFHRSDSFPHVHHPLKPQYHRVRRRSHRTSTSEDTPPPYAKLESQEEEPEEEQKGGVLFEIGDPDIPEGWSTGKNRINDTVERKESRSGSPKKGKAFDVEEEEDEEFQPLLGDGGALKPCIRPSESDRFPFIDDSSRKKSRVQFDIGDGEEHLETEYKGKPRRRRSHKRRNDAEDPSWRRHAGSEHELQSRAIATTEEEAEYLQEHDLDEISSHRFDDPSGYLRPRVRARSSVASIIHVSDKDQSKSGRQLPIMKKSYDHSPHEVFVELDELKYSEGRLEWKETARWIKYEEDVEDIDNRWGKPHIAFLNFHALFSLRKGLDSGKNI